MDQKSIVLHNLNYSHKDADVLKLMSQNNIFSVYILAGCKDVMQTCDTVANKPFKVGLKAALKYNFYDELNKWLALNPDKETRGVWDPKVNMSILEERINSFVNISMDTLKTPEMKICIANAFARDSRFTKLKNLTFLWG